MKKLLEKFYAYKKKTKENKEKNEMLDSINRARAELMAAEVSFNETVKDDYIDVAILNMNIAKKKYEILISEAKEFYRAG